MKKTSKLIAALKPVIDNPDRTLRLIAIIAVLALAWFVIKFSGAPP